MGTSILQYLVEINVVAPRRLRVFNAPGAALADASLGGRSYLAELVAVLFVLVHLVVRDSLAGHGVYLRFVFEGHTVAPLPGPAR